MIDLEPIKERLTAATPGPWFADAIEFHHDWTYEGDGICCTDCGARWEGESE